MDCGKAQTMMDLSDDRWLELKGGHRTRSDPRPLVAKLEAEQDVENSWHELWGEPCPQGDLGEASYASLPHVEDVSEPSHLPMGHVCHRSDRRTGPRRSKSRGGLRMGISQQSGNSLKWEELIYRAPTSLTKFAQY